MSANERVVIERVVNERVDNERVVNERVTNYEQAKKSKTNFQYLIFYL